MEDQKNNRPDDTGSIAATIVFYGGLWGLAEATLGFALHAIPRVLPIPNLAGAVMFPVALLVMIGVIRATGRPAAAMGAAVVAASIKASSVALPLVPFLFVRNPVMAILAEGGIVTVGAIIWARSGRTVRVGAPGAPGTHSRAVIAGWALAVSLGWRVLFLGMNLLLGITNGIMARPVGAIAQFVVIESLWNAGVILAGVLLVGGVSRIDIRREDARTAPKSLRVSAMLTVIVALGSEWGIAILPI